MNAPDLDTLILSLSAINTDTTSRAVEVIAELRRELAASQAALTIYEDDLPESMTDAEYATWFAASRVVEGVRMGPRFIPVATDEAYRELRARAEKAEAALVSERKDAERYRWLRDSDECLVSVSVNVPYEDGSPSGGFDYFSGSELDAVIDEYHAKPAIEEQTK